MIVKKFLQTLRVLAVIAFWITCSSATILFNSWILSEKDFHYPMFLTAWHMLFSTLVTLVLRNTPLITTEGAPKFGVREYLTKVVPIGLFFAFSLVLSNKAYLYLSVAYIQMVKAFTPVAVYMITVIVGVDIFSTKLGTVVVVISGGVLLASYGEIKFDLFGFIIQVSAVIFEASRLVCVQILLKGWKLNALTNLSLVAPICFVFIAIPCYFFEWSEIQAENAIDRLGYLMFVLNASVAFCLNIALLLVVQYTSSLALTLSGIVKDALLVILSVILFETPVTATQIVGFTISISGINYYKILRDSMNKEVVERAKAQAELEQMESGKGLTLISGPGKAEQLEEDGEARAAVDDIPEETDPEAKEK